MKNTNDSPYPKFTDSSPIAPKTNNNAAIISLLNSAPAAMTNSSVMSSTAAANPSPDGTLIVQQQPAQHQQSQNNIQGTVRKINVQNVLNSAQLVNLHAVACPQTGPQQLSVRVTMSALANQLSSPPAVMSSSPIHPQTYNFAQMKPSSQQHTQQIILSTSPAATTNNRLLSQQSLRRGGGESVAIPSPGSDSNASSASSSNMGSSFAIGPGGFSTFLATSPTASILR